MTIKESDVSEGVALRDHIAEQITHVEQRIKDGDEMGPRIWRIALEDVARENRAVLATVSPPLPSPGVERLKEALEMAARGFRKHGRLWLASNERRTRKLLLRRVKQPFPPFPSMEGGVVNQVPRIIGLPAYQTCRVRNRSLKVARRGP
jgi:hypothetical protein